MQNIYGGVMQNHNSAYKNAGHLTGILGNYASKLKSQCFKNSLAISMAVPSMVLSRMLPD